MCVPGGCKITENTLSSMYIPEGKKVTLYTGKYFEGKSITYHGPHRFQIRPVSRILLRSSSPPVYCLMDEWVGEREMRVGECILCCMWKEELEGEVRVRANWECVRCVYTLSHAHIERGGRNSERE